MNPALNRIGRITVENQENGTGQVVCSRCDCDTVVVGAGPAGLAAALNLAAEGIRPVCVDASPQTGGQAGTSSLIENYLGFPEGISGPELAGLAVEQAHRLGASFRLPFRVEEIRREGDRLVVISDLDEQIVCRSVVLALGVAYRTLNAENLALYLGRGVSYGSPAMDKSFENDTVAIVGGANSAGQGAAYLSNCKGCNVHILVRGEGLDLSMSRYLIDKLEDAPNVHIHTQTVVEGAFGTPRNGLTGLNLKGPSGFYDLPVSRLFVMIGAVPQTRWLNGYVEKSSKGFICTGADVSPDEWDLNRTILSGETSFPGVFAVGDVREGAIRRVAGAVGDGSGIASSVFRYLNFLASQGEAAYI